MLDAEAAAGTGLLDGVQSCEDTLAQMVRAIPTRTAATDVGRAECGATPAPATAAVSGAG